MLSNIVLAGALIGSVVGLPAADIEARQSYATAGMCSSRYDYTVDSHKVHESSVTMSNAKACTSSSTQPCTVGANWSQSFGVTISAGASLDLSAIFSVNTQVSFTYTTTTGSTVGEGCPVGGYVCGLTVKNNLVDVTGDKVETATGLCGISGQEVSRDHYAFTAPVTVNGDAQATYAACVSASSPNQDLATAGLSACPGGF